MGNIYKQGLHRNQQLLLPPSIDDYVDEDNVVRAIESYVEVLDLKRLEFCNTRNDGQKASAENLYLWIFK